MQIRITNALLRELEQTLEYTKRRQGTGKPDPSDPVYLKILAAPKGKTGCVIDADAADVAELLSRAEYDIETCDDNITDTTIFAEKAYWMGRKRSYKALIRQIRG